MKKITIAIDGFSSCGKSTLAKSLASKIGYGYIDTGAMYRAATYYLLKNNIILSNGSNIDESHVEKHLKDINVTFVYNPTLKASETHLNGQNVERDIRDMFVSNFVSQVSLLKSVRHKMVNLQKKMGKDKGVVMEGRDIGTNVFPNAELKIFMTADIEVRIQRRFDELHSKGQMATKQEIKQNLEMRDFEDSNRKENPLMQAPDAIVLDNSELSRKDQLNFVLKLINDLLLMKDE
jgi:cytidylate kinase